jgi:hypothetical protein
MDSCVEFYNEFLEQVKSHTNNETSSYANQYIERVNRFYDSLENDDLFTIFASAKIKIFSAKTVETHTISTSLFDENLTLKHIFNNMAENVKDTLWIGLYNLYIQLERYHNKHPERVGILKDMIKNIRGNHTSKARSDLFKNVIKADVNSTTTNMLDDIIGSFQNVMSNNGNPFENIMSITEQITQKYGSQIENGDIEVDKILGGMGGMFSGITGDKKDEPVIMDENFSTANVEVGNEEEKKGFNLGDIGKLAPLADMINKVTSIKTEDDAMRIKEDMDSFMEKELKVDMSQYKQQMEDLEKKMEEMKRQTSTVEDVDSPTQ